MQSRLILSMWGRMISCAPVVNRRWAAAGYQPAAGCQPAPQAGTSRRCGLRASIVILMFALAACMRADQPLPAMLEGVGVDEKIGRNIDLDLTFIAENGYPVPLRQFFHAG